MCDYCVCGKDLVWCLVVRARVSVCVVLEFIVGLFVLCVIFFEGFFFWSCHHSPQTVYISVATITLISTEPKKKKE